MSVEEGESYHRALAQIHSAASLEDAKSIAFKALRAWRAKPIAELDQMNGLKTYGNAVDD